MVNFNNRNSKGSKFGVRVFKYNKNIYCEYVKNDESCPYGHKCKFNHNMPYKYKSQLCMNFGTEAGCKKGDNCCYAHDEDELVN